MTVVSDLASDYSPSGFFVIRTPLLPFSDLVVWGSGLTAPGLDMTGEALADDRRRLRERLRQILERPDVREAIRLASPALESHVDDWINDPGSPHGIEYERAIVRYVLRMAGRPTPFGLFAGVSSGRIGDETCLRLDGRAGHRRHTRLDAGYLLSVVEGLLAEPGRRERTSYRPNPSLYLVGGRRRYVRTRPGAEERRHLLVSVRDSTTLQAALDAAGDGSTPSGIADALASAGTEPARAQRFVEDLIEQQVLVPGLEVQMTGADAVYGLGDAAAPLAAARAALGALDAEPLGVGPDRYRAVVSLLEALPAPMTMEPLFQVDMTKESPQATLGHEVVNEILRGALLLQRIAPQAEDKRFTGFIERFRERFEGRAVPLLEALDPDMGVGFDGDDPATAPLLAGLDRRHPRTSPTSWTERDAHLLSRLLSVRDSGASELVLDARDIERLERQDPPPLPDAFAVMAMVAARSEADLGAGRFQVLTSGPSGPSGARLLGRFCHVDPVLRAAVEAHLRAEAALDPDAVYAEIVHLPRARDVNVAARPVLREYEIECLGRSGAAPDHRIALDDLMLSLDSDEFVLSSRRLGRRVVPRLTSAHDYSGRGAAVYRFLCRLQDRDADGGGFWGALASSPFLPRVRVGRVILARARWRLRPDDLAPSGGRDADHLAVQAWRRDRRVPRYVMVMEPFELPLDLDNVLVVDSLVQAVRAARGVQLQELIPGPDELPVEGPEGAFVHELVVPFIRTRPSSQRRARAGIHAPVERTFPPGSDWVYARLYTGETMADRILTEDIAPLVADVVGSGSVDRWFFLRYRDPEFHLRIRLRGSARSELEALGAALVRGGRAWRIELGTYEREVERYGGPDAIDLIERVFQADSDAVLALLTMLEPGSEGQEERWQIALAGADRLLVDLGLERTERYDLVSSIRTARERALSWAKPERTRIGQRFRQERRLMAQLLGPAVGAPEALAPGIEVLEARTRVVRPIGDALRTLERAGRLTIPISDIAASLLHMHLNRLLRGDNVAQEAVICDLLTRLYEAESKRGPGSSARPPDEPAPFTS